MIHSLEVRNFVNIATAALEFPETGFCALTGETGVGKSMLVDALTLLLGARPKRNLIREGSERAEISAVFDIEADSLAANWLPDQQLADKNGELVVRRVIDRKGRSRCYINDSAVTLTQLETVVGMLIAVCGQNENVKLASAQRRRFLLDTAAKSNKLAQQVATSFSLYQEATKALALATDRFEASQAQAEQLQADLQEIEALNFNAETWEENNRILDLQANAQEINELQNRLDSNVAELDSLVANSLPDAKRLAELLPSTKEIQDDLISVESLAADVSRACTKLGESSGSFDQQAYEDAEHFVGEAQRLARKHRLLNAEQLIEFTKQLHEQLAKLALDDVDALDKKAKQCLANWQKLAAKLTAKRKAQASKLASGVQNLLRQLGMPAARFKIDLVAQEEPTRFGAEEVEFLFAARAKGSMNRIGEVASGGEMSRLTLALFSLTGGDGTRSLIFDEVDSGVSGKTAAHVGALLAKLGQQRLVLCVSHLPQVAAAAQRHWLVSADPNEGLASFTAITGKSREEEIARMLAGRQVTEASRNNAREILASATG